MVSRPLLPTFTVFVLCFGFFGFNRVSVKGFLFLGWSRCPYSHRNSMLTRGRHFAVECEETPRSIHVWMKRLLGRRTKMATMKTISWRATARPALTSLHVRSSDVEEHSSSKKVRLEVFKTLNLPQVEVFSVLAVLLSSLLVALDSLQELPPVVYDGIDHAILTLNLLFAFDFFIRWYAAGQFKAIYLTKPLVVLDIVVVILPLVFGHAIVPLLESLGVTGDAVTYLHSLQNSAGLQNLLLLRVLRLRRVLTDINTFAKFEIALGVKPKDVRPYQLQLARVLLSIFTLLSVASGLIYAAEHEVNPEIPDYFSALYFGLTTLTTVGFGDITPITAQGRLIVAGSILAGVAIIPTQAAKLVDIFIESQKDLEQKKGFRRRGRPSLFSSVSGKQPTSMQSATDGQGPSGASIDIPNEERGDYPSSSNVISSLLEQDSGAIGRTCSICKAAPHRRDATCCWSCGERL